MEQRWEGRTNKGMKPTARLVQSDRKNIEVRRNQ